MTASQSIVLILFAFALLLGIIIFMRPGATRERSGKILAFGGLLAVPLLATWAGGAYHLEHSKSTEFCLSCHVMAGHGRSLSIDDPGYLPAAHFQNNRVPRDSACYACHTHYTMYGDIQSKWRGLRHVYVNYIGTTPDPADIELYSPYHNRECLYCHEGARSFEEGEFHVDALAELKSNEMSCLACHDTVHAIENLSELPLRRGSGDAQ